MQLQSFYPIVVTEHLTACRDFYARWFGLEVVFEASWFVLLSAGEAGPASLAFMHPGHPSAPPGPERFNGQGMCLEFQVADARAEHVRFVRDGAPITLSLRDEPFGQRRFGLFDPAGVWIDVVEQIEPAAGWWDRYLPATPEADTPVTAWLRWLVIPAAAAVWMGASSPAVSQRMPRFLFPGLAVVGAALTVRLVIRAVRAYRSGGRITIFGLALTAVAALLLVVLPFARFLYMLAPSADGAPRILAGFGDWRGSEGYPRPDPHRGIDVAGRVGSDVLAAADGRVTVARDNQDLCGLIVVVAHDPHGYRTIYCHLATISVKAGESVARGQPIGTLGTTGQRAWPGYEHVHLELQRGGDRKDIHDPVPRIVGCFDAAQRYAADRLVLTYPVKC